MKKMVLWVFVLTFAQALAQTNCMEQYSGSYHCFNNETGQTTNIHITPYPETAIQPLEMPDLSVLPDPTSMMYMDHNQANDLLNPRLAFNPNVGVSPLTQQTLNNIAQQRQQLIAETNRMAEQVHRQQMELMQQQNLASQQRIQANQQRLAQLEAQKRTNQTVINDDNNRQNSTTQNYIIVGLVALILILAFALGVVWQKNKSF